MKHFKSLLKISIIVAFCLLSLTQESQAQLSFSSPSSNTRLKACDDYATAAFGDPWDMSSNTDINYYIQSDLSNISNPTFAGGYFSFITASESPTFHLLSPVVCGAFPSGGRYGVQYPVDVSKYTQLSLKMYTDSYDAGGGFLLVWHRGCDYTKTRTVSNFQTTRVGWSTYKVDLNNISISSSASSNTNPWSSGNINGFAILPTHKSGAQIIIDSIRLEDPTSCGSTSVNYTATTQNGRSFVNMFIDADQDPFNGYDTQLLSAQTATGSSSVTASTSGLPSGDYYVTGYLTDDYATAKRNDPWDFKNEEDVVIAGGITNGGMSGGAYTGTTSGSNSSAIYLRTGTDGIDASVFNKLSFKLTRSGGGAIVIIATKSTGSQDLFIVPDSALVGGDVYNVDLSTAPWSGGSFWNGTITEVIVRPSSAASITFSLDFVGIGKNNYISAESQLTSSLVTASGLINVNNPPLVNIVKPDVKGGEALRPWNMKNGDFILYHSLRNDTDPSVTSEPYTAWLPDVRTVGGRRGDFFKGTNQLGIDHSVNYSTFPYFTNNPITFSADEYKHLCVMLMNDRETDVCLGAIVRPYWVNTDGSFTTAVAAVTITNRWTGSRWFEYCFDMKNIELNYANQEGWLGTKIGFRVDPNEYYKDTCGTDGTPTGNGTSTTYYYDYIKLRKDFEANDKFVIVYSLTDPDDTAQVNFYYNSSKSTSGGTLINGSAISEGAQTRSYLWNTTAVPDGTYYIYATVTDGINTVSRLAASPVKINHSLARSVTQPILSVEAPVADQTYCSSLQVKGYSLMERYEDIATIEVSVDGTLLGNLQPQEYSPNAVAAYPNLDSSNSGFNQSYDISGLTSGSHTLTVTSKSTDGQETAVTRSFVKGGTGCASEVTDASPSGSIITVELTDTPVPTATPTSGSSGNPSISKVSLSKAGVFKMSVSNATTGGTCSLNLNLGTSENALTSTVSNITAKKTKVSLTQKSVGVNNKKLKSIFVQVQRTCSGQTASSSAKKFSVPKMTISGKIKSISAFAKALKKIKAS